MNPAPFSFLDGAVMDANTVRLLALEDERARAGIGHGLILTRRGGAWRGVEVGETLVSCTTTAVPEYAFVAIAESGREVTIGNDALEQYVIASGPDSPAANGPLVQVRCIAGVDVFAVGTARQVYRKRSLDAWQRADETCKPSAAKRRASTAFLAIDGYSASEVYACGWNGALWIYDGAAWQALESPSTLMLHGLCCSSDGHVYVCGQRGTLFRGRGDTWARVGQSTTDDDLRSVCEYEGVVYVSSTSAIYAVAPEGLVRITMDIPCSTAGKLTAGHGVLMSVGLKHVVVFDGAHWRSII